MNDHKNQCVRHRPLSEERMEMGESLFLMKDIWRKFLAR